MNEHIFRLLAENPSELKGLSIEGTIPLTERIINKLIENELKNNRMVKYCKVSIGDQNHVKISMVIFQWIDIPFKLEARIERVIDFTVTPILKIHLLDDTILRIAKLVGLFRRLAPTGVTIDGGVITIDLMTIRYNNDWKALLRLVKWSEIVTINRTAYINFKIKVE